MTLVRNSPWPIIPRSPLVKKQNFANLQKFIVVFETNIHALNVIQLLEHLHELLQRGVKIFFLIFTCHLVD